jgi:hypothetical protein
LVLSVTAIEDVLPQLATSRISNIGKSVEAPLLDYIPVENPSWLTKEEIEKLGSVPVQIIAPENGPAFTVELKRHAIEVVIKKSAPYDYQHFPGVSHGFSTRGNPNNERERRATIRAKNAIAGWMDGRVATWRTVVTVNSIDPATDDIQFDVIPVFKSELRLLELVCVGHNLISSLKKLLVRSHSSSPSSNMLSTQFNTVPCISAVNNDNWQMRQGIIRGVSRQVPLWVGICGYT